MATRSFTCYTPFEALATDATGIRNQKAWRCVLREGPTTCRAAEQPCDSTLRWINHVPQILAHDENIGCLTSRQPIPAVGVKRWMPHHPPQMTQPNQPGARANPTHMPPNHGLPKARWNMP